MIRPLFRDSVILVLFFSVLLTGEDILENYRPAPGLPEELNGWLANVQRHKEDFALIRREAQKFERYEMPVNNERKREFKPKYLVNLDDDEVEGYSEDKPENDIYPYMYRRRMIEPLVGIVESPFITRKLRLRRDSAEANKAFHRNDIRLNLQAENGEIFRSADKYPGRYKNDPEKDVKKRDIHIDVYSDGKLIKQTNAQDSKAVILNIQPSEDSVGKNQFIQTSQAKRAMHCPKCSGLLARNSEKTSSGNSKEEVDNNFRNLFLENEHLNTDTSIHYQNPIIYHVSLPDINAYLKSATTEEINNLAIPNENNMKNHNYQNNLDDMSPYWSQTEKNIMQKGLEVAQKIVNIPTKMTQTSFDKNGFEKIESIVVDDTKESIRANDKRQLKIRNHYNNMKDTDNQTSRENELFDSKALQKKIFDSNQIIRSHHKYGPHFQILEQLEKKIPPARNEDGSSEKEQIIPKTFDQENKEDEQLVLDDTPNEILPLTEKDIDIISDVGNMPLDIDKMISNQRQTYTNNKNQNIENEFKNENDNFEPQQKNVENEIPVENRYSSDSYGDYDRAKVEVRFDSPTHDNENDFVPNNFIGAGKKRPLNNLQFDHYNRKRRNFVLKKIKQIPETNEFLKITNEQEASNMDSQPETQYENLPSLDTNKQSLDALVPFYLPSKQENRQSDSISDLLETENKFINEEITTSTQANAIISNIDVVFSQSEQKEKGNITPFPPKKQRKQDIVEEADSRLELNTINKIYEENTDEKNLTYKPAVLIVINPQKPEESEDEDVDKGEYIRTTSKQIIINEAKENVSADLNLTGNGVNIDKIEIISTEKQKTHSKTIKPFISDILEKEEKKPIRNYGEKQLHHFPFKKVEQIQEHIETNRVVTKIQTFTIEISPCTPPHNGDSEDFTESPIKPTMDRISISVETLPDHDMQKSFKHSSNLKQFPKKRMQLHYLSATSAEESTFSSEMNGLSRLKKRRHHRERKRKEKKQRTKKNWLSHGTKDYVVNEEKVIDNPNRDLDSIPAFVGRQLKALNCTTDDDLKYQECGSVINRNNSEHIVDNEREFIDNYRRDTDSIPAFMGRKLKSQDYIYDVDLGYPDLEEVINQKKKEELHDYRKRGNSKEGVSTIRSVLHKDSAEGDYGEEEESDNTTNKKNNIKPIKKTNNEFAHPVTQSTESEDYYDDEDYDQETRSKTSTIKNTRGKQEKKTSLKKTTRVFHRPKPTEKQKKSKPPRRNQQNSEKSSIGGKSKLMWKRDEQKQKTITNSKLPKDSEFQQWPKFLRNDQENEELMRKRSLATTSQSTKTNTFPLSTNSFFVTSQKEKRSTDSENVDKSLANKAAFVGDEEKNAVTGLVNVTQMESVNLPDVSLNLDSDAKLLNTLLPMPISTGTPTELFDDGITLFSNIEANTTNPCTESLHEVISNACEDNQDFFNRTQIPISSVLPLFSEMENPNGETYEAFEKLDQIITGDLPFRLIDDMLYQLKSSKHLKHFRKGLKKTFSKESLDNILDSSNMESKKIITEMSNLLNKLQISTNCQALHPRLKHYLKLITKAITDTVLRRAKEMEGKPLDVHQNSNARKNFVFSSGELGDNLEDKAGVLKDLLNKYQNLPDQCKPRALPLKEYIERHLGMLNNILSENDNNNNKVAQEEGYSSKDSEQNSDIDRPVQHRSLDKDMTKSGIRTVNREKALIDEQLEDLGLSGNQKFKPNFDLNDLINQKRSKKDTIGRGKPYGYSKNANNKRIMKRHSESYEKLLNAIAKEKMRKIRENRLGEMYGKFNDDLFNYNEKSKQDVNGFESPLVYSF